MTRTSSSTKRIGWGSMADVDFDEIPFLIRTITDGYIEAVYNGDPEWDEDEVIDCFMIQPSYLTYRYIDPREPGSIGEQLIKHLNELSSQYQKVAELVKERTATLHLYRMINRDDRNGIKVPSSNAENQKPKTKRRKKAALAQA